MRRTASVFFVLILTVASLAIVGLLRLGSALPGPAGHPTAVLAAEGASAVGAMMDGISKNSGEPLSHLFLQLGALMNTRGLMELIALNMGYDLGILSPAIFTMLVVMAIATTILIGPLLTLFGEKGASFAEMPELSRS